MMFDSRKIGRLVVWMIVAVLLLLCGTAMAVETDEYGAKYIYGDDPSMVDVDIIDFKVKLYQMGFYSAGVSDTILQSRELDNLTMAAVKLVCSYNPELIYYDNGVSNYLYWHVMGIMGAGLKTPLSATYEAFVLGDSDDAITSVQNRLNQLGYDNAGYSFTPGVYDEELQAVIDEFVRCNKFVYEREDGITVEMQELLFSDGAAAYVKEKSLSDAVFGYLKGSSAIGGVHIPNIAMLGIGFLMLCVIVLLVIGIAVPNNFKAMSNIQEGRALKGKRRAVRRGKKDAEMVFKIEYGTSTYVHRVEMNKYVRIGRATGDFPLNIADESISRKHCEICCEGDVVMLRDFSSYGTNINGEVCHHTQRALHSGDVIEVGAHRITIEF